MSNPVNHEISYHISATVMYSLSRAIEDSATHNIWDLELRSMEINRNSMNSDIRRAISA